jgi:hypothetical protein
MERDNVAIIETEIDRPLTRTPDLSGVKAGPLWDPHYLGLARSDCFGIIGFFPYQGRRTFRNGFLRVYCLTVLPAPCCGTLDTPEAFSGCCALDMPRPGGEAA